MEITTYRFPRRLFSVVVGLITVTFLHAQASGFNISFGYANCLAVSDQTYKEPNVVLGMAYQQDLDRRFGVALDFFYGGNNYGSTYGQNYDWIYSAKYFTSDNDDATAFYIGTFFGYQKVKATFEKYVPNNSGYGSYVKSAHNHVQFPLGIRAGVRGGLSGYFAELFAQVGYSIGNGLIFHTPDGATVRTTPLYFTLGCSFLGGGWNHRSSRN